MAWEPTLPELKFTVRRLVGTDGWQECAFEDLRPGDLAQFRSPAGELICPGTEEPNDSVVAHVESAPMKMDEAAGHPRSVGLGVQITLYESLEDFRRNGAN